MGAITALHSGDGLLESWQIVAQRRPIALAAAAIIN
jgi:hypothetical protein